ncbi:MAG: hypothetical protein HKN13_11905 [Rhodothermales bacterium]|nr:hypothetical protein [Rhodothermales bacterium]
MDGEVELDASEMNSASAPSPVAAAVDTSSMEALVGEDGAAAFSARLRQQTFSCGDATIRRLAELQYVNVEDANEILSSFGYYVNDLPDKSGVLDIVAFLIWIKLESKEEKAVKEIRNITNILKSSGTGKIGHMGFAHLNDTPGSLYQGHPRILEICSTMMCPVIQNNEADFVTLTSVNPITAVTAGELISLELEKDTGTKPFITVMTTDSNAWSFLCEKHFGL